MLKKGSFTERNTTSYPKTHVHIHSHIRRLSDRDLTPPTTLFGTSQVGSPADGDVFLYQFMALDERREKRPHCSHVYYCPH